MSKNGSAVLATFKARLPDRQQVLLVFAACVLPVFAWALLVYIDQLPALILRLTVWELLGVTSYIFALALVESLVLLMPILLLTLILPTRVFKEHFIAIGSLIVLISSVWLMYANHNDSYDAEWTTTQLLLILAAYLLSLAIPIALVFKFRRLEAIIQSVMERIAVLAYIYVALACVAVVIVIIRNI